MLDFELALLACALTTNKGTFTNFLWFIYPTMHTFSMNVFWNTVLQVRSTRQCICCRQCVSLDFEGSSLEKKSTPGIYEMFITIQTLSLTDSIFTTPERLHHTNNQWKQQWFSIISLTSRNQIGLTGTVSTDLLFLISLLFYSLSYSIKKWYILVVI